MSKGIKRMAALLAFAGFAGTAMAATPSPEVYGFRIEKINQDDDAYRYGNLYLLTGPDRKEQYIIVRDVSGAVAIVKREPSKAGK